MEPILLSVQKIWEGAPHNAFTDLVCFKGAWFCAFREGEKHARCAGKIRVITSTDGIEWESAALLEEKDVDLRDPHFSIRSDGFLEMVMGGTYFRDGGYVGRRPRVSISADGMAWSAPKPILADGDWLWRVTRRESDGQAFGISYRLPRKNFWTIHLMKSTDGEQYTETATMKVNGKPNEATIRFGIDGQAITLVRRESGPAKAWIGTSMPPYTDWNWNATKEYIGGPNFLMLGEGELWAAGRFIRRGKARTALALMTTTSVEPVLFLPSSGDCSYPGMVAIGDTLTMSYYSSHEGKTSIYLAQIMIDRDTIIL
ncbi:MAG: hypothetical protein WCT14_15505 [Treponemataceae bacterium]